MATDAVRIRLPQVLVVDAGRDGEHLPPDLDAGVLLRDIDLSALIGLSLPRGTLVALDVDSIHGLRGDEAGVEFAFGRLGIGVIITRRPKTASLVAEAGGLALLQVMAYDSTGMARALDGHPGDGVGTVVSPGLVLAHMRPEELARLPRPVLAYGLIESPEDAMDALRSADSIVIGSGPANVLAEHLGPRPAFERNPLTTVAMQE